MVKQTAEIQLGVALMTCSLNEDDEAIMVLSGVTHWELYDALMTVGLTLAEELADRRGIETGQVLAELGWRAAAAGTP